MPDESHIPLSTFCGPCGAQIVRADDGAWQDRSGACGCSLSPSMEHKPIPDLAPGHWVQVSEG
jgi:hypothetical protein